MTPPAPVDLAEMARELVPRLVGFRSEFRREIILRALERAHLAGQRFMQERAAEWCDDNPDGKTGDGTPPGDAIRALVPDLPAP